MSIRKRGGVYVVDIRTPSGKRIRRTCSTQDRKEAQEYHDKLKADLWRASKLGEKPPRTFEEAALRYLKQEAGKKDYESKKRHLVWFSGHFAGRHIHMITRADIMAALPVLDQRRLKEPRPISEATRNRYLATIHAMLSDAVKKWDWMDAAPAVNRGRESEKRIRWITPDEARRLLSEIRVGWVRDITELAFNTGLRYSNLTGLEWSQVDLVKKRAWIHPDQAKAAKPIGVPLNQAAIEVIRRQIGKHDQFVFLVNGGPGRKLDNRQWDKACARAGIENFRFHDTRHTWASWHVQGGTPLNALMELGGWSDYKMVLKYAHLAPDHLAQHAELVTFRAHSIPVIRVTDGKLSA
ncbi:MAG TPA: site-specific integrase [Paraburkholderia sp.]